AGRNSKALDALCAEIGEAASPAIVDVRDRAAVARVINDAAALNGRLDLVYNGAGIGLLALLEDTSAQHWDEILGANLSGVVNGVAAAYPIMKANGAGQIINMASLAG